MNTSSDSDINSKDIQPFELDIYGISADDVLLREFDATKLKAAVVAMRNVVKTTYNNATPSRKF
ncbi:MAG: hypothetical protein ACK521_00015 [bacterium]